MDLSKPSACHRTVHAKAAIQKIKRKSKRGKRISCRKLVLEMGMSFSSAYRILRKDLKMKSYKTTVELLLKDEHKAQRKNFVNWTRKEFRKQDTMRILFPMKKCLILTASITVKMIVHGPLIGRKQIEKLEKKRQRKFAKKVMVWLAACSECVAPLVLLEKGTLDHHRCIKEVLSVALRYGNSKFGNNWTFEQDNGTAHTHKEAKAWCSQHFPSFIDKDTWSSNSPDFNPLD